MSNNPGRAYLYEHKELIEHEAHDLLSFWNGLKEGYKPTKTGEVKQIPEVRELIHTKERQFIRQTAYMKDMAKIKTLAWNLRREVELAIYKIAKEKPEIIKSESSHVADKPKEKSKEVELKQKPDVENTSSKSGKGKKDQKNQPATVNTRDFYADIGVSPNATPEEIKKAYRKLARELHPDVNPDKAAAERFGRVTEAYATLSDSNKKSSYDTARSTPQKPQSDKPQQDNKQKPQGQNKQQPQVQTKQPPNRGGNANSHESKPVRAINAAPPKPSPTKPPQTKPGAGLSPKKPIAAPTRPPNKGSTQQTKPGIISKILSRTNVPLTPIPNFRRIMPASAPKTTEVETTTITQEQVFQDRGIVSDRRTEDIFIPPSSAGQEKSESKTTTKTTQDEPAAGSGGSDGPDGPTRRNRRKKRKGGTLREGRQLASALREGGMLARAGTMVAPLLSNPWVWLGLAILIIFLLIIAAGGFDSEEAKKRAAAEKCQGPKETLSIAKTGPTQAVNGQVLQYTITVKDSAPSNEVTIVDQLPNGISLNPADITSNWKMTVTGNTVTWKVSENVPPGALNSPYEFAFNVTLKANADSAHLLYVVDANRAGGPATKPGGKPVIVLDPGHGGGESTVTDPESGLIDKESANTPEREEVFEVAQKVKAKLEADGYTVILTKASPMEISSHRGRATIANNANATLAVSIHNDHIQPYSWAEVYTQNIGLYREVNGKRLEFTDLQIALKSQEYGKVIAQERAAVEGRPVPLRDANFDTRVGYSSGNIPLVMLFAKVPWVYNEIGAAPVGVHVPPDQIDKYAQGIIQGIEKAVPVTGAAAGTGDGCAPQGGATNENYVPHAPADSCGGKYASYIQRNTLLPMNFGDPQCNFDKDKLHQLLMKLENNNEQFVNFWFITIIPHESGFQPNAWAKPVGAQARLDAGGAWGLYQKGSSTPPGSPPPAPGKNGPLDRGDVNWEVQTGNAVQANKDVGCDFWYYGTFRRSAEGSKGKVKRC